MKRLIPLLPEYEAFIDQLIETGRYPDASEIIMEALALPKNQEVARGAKLGEFLAHIDEGLGDIDAGRTKPAEEVFARLYHRIDAAKSRQEAAE